ncbi:MAG TPA: CoA ester lyase [Rhizomicrobium sp.]|nr:CoA ester lyase [Rhizomicrobium sp.]
MRLRSLLFVPGDRPERMTKALAAGADALIVDLEDAVATGRKADARRCVVEFLAQPRSVPVFVRINPLGVAKDDLAAIVPQRPDGIVLPKARGGEAVAELDGWLTALGDHQARILPIATETPVAVFGLGSYGGVSKRLCALTWGAEDLSAVLGATATRENDGRFTSVYQTVRALTLIGAGAAGVPALETVYPDFRDAAGLQAHAARARRDGFCGMLAIHPDQVPVINDAFRPSPAEIVWATRVVAAFAANPGAGVLDVDGKMVDAPHLKQAHRLLDDSGA